MKIRLFLLAFAQVIIPNLLTAQSWELLNPKPTCNTFTNGFFINDSTGCLITYGGEIFRTSNSGKSFEIVFKDDTYSLDGIDFINDSKGFAVGQSGYDGNFIAKTTDGGLTWTKLPDPGGYTYFDVKFIDETHGWICGWYNTIIRTTNGGETWQKLSGNVWSDNLFETCDFINQDTGFFGGSWGYYPYVPVLYKTFDGGVTLIPVNLPEQSKKIKDIVMLSENEIWLCEGFQVQGSASRLYHSLDGGASWQIINLGYYTNTCDKLIFMDSVNSMAIGSSSCFITHDGWQTWNQFYYSPDCLGAMFSGNWVSDSIAYVYGQNGEIAITINGGSLWQPVSTGIRAELCDIEFFDDQHGCVVGSYGLTNCIAYTTDGGSTWKESDFTHDPYFWILDVMYTSENEVWAAGWQDMVYHSVDGGVSWSTGNIANNITDYFYSICLVPGGKLYAGGSNLYSSDNNGITWDLNNFNCPGYNIRKIVFPDSETGYMVLYDNGTFGPDYGRMYKTSDGGYTWEGIPLVNEDSLIVMSVDFLTKDVGLIYLSDRQIYKTIDGGETWTQCNYSGINGCNAVYLKMFDENNVVASGPSRQVMYSFDGGINWRPGAWNDKSKPVKSTLLNPIDNMHAPAGISMVYGRYFSEMGKGWRCGEGGIIEKYSDLYVHIPEANQSSSLDVLIFPNPTSGIINFNSNDIPDKILMYNSHGTKIYQNDAPTNTLDLKSLPIGQYIILLIKEGKQRAVKIIRV